MEDERGAGGHGSGIVVSEPPLSDELTDKSIVENMRSDNQVEEVFEEGDGEEIMVEVVGSDVYVDGVSGSGEGDCEMAEAGDLEGGVVEKNEESIKEQGLNEEVDTNLSISIGVEKVTTLPVGGVGGRDDEAMNDGVRAVDESSIEVSGRTEGEGVSSMEISEGKKNKDEVVDKDSSDLVKPEPSNHPMEAVSDDKTDPAEESEGINDGVSGNMHSVDASGEGDLLVGSQKDGSPRAKVESPSSDSDRSSLHDEKEVRAAESKDSIPELDESQNCSKKSHDAKLEQIDQTCGSQIGETGGNNESSMTEGDLETHKAQNDVLSTMPIQLADGGDMTVINKDDGLSVDVKEDAAVVGSGEKGIKIDSEMLVSPTDISLLDESVNQENEMPNESNGFRVAEAVEGHLSEAKPMDVDNERESDPTYHGDAELSSEGTSSESDKSKISIQETVRMKQLGYLMPPENGGGFAPSDLVWGKVRSHPWWPGQIFDPSNASEKAMKYHKKDSYLVAYFGDQTFAWNEASALKPFRSNFSQIEKQSNSESFHNAVDSALDEVERRVKLGLSCSCTLNDNYGKIEAQVVENTGIREESSRRYGVDRSSCGSCFEPSEFLEFITTVAPCASFGADRLDLLIARAQLSAFCSFKGYRLPIEFPSSSELHEIDGEDIEQKHAHIPKEGAHSMKERSSIELPPPTTQPPKPSFKIGECIRRVANQLTSSTPIKGSNDEMVVDGEGQKCGPSEKQTLVVSAESLSVNDMLKQLELLAQDPKKRRSNEIRSFFMGFRSSTALTRRGRKKKSEQAVGGSGEEFEFDDVNDSYWTDRIVQNYSADQLLHDRVNGAQNLQLASFDEQRNVKPGRKPHSRKRFYMGNSPTPTTEIDEKAKRMKQDSNPAELILSFAERNRVPSEINLNKMFRRFGPLMESETEVDHESGSAKVIFKRGSDAEVARNSAEKFSIFGPVVVSYEIGYEPVISVKISPVMISQSQEANLML